MRIFPLNDQVILGIGLPSYMHTNSTVVFSGTVLLELFILRSVTNAVSAKQIKNKLKIYFKKMNPSKYAYHQNKWVKPFQILTLQP